MTWWDEMRRAAQENTRSALVAASFDGVPVDGLASAIAMRIPYRFAPRQPTLPWEGCLARRYAACADAASLVTAIAARAGKVDDVKLCFETDPSTSLEYAHVRAIWGPFIVDPYSEQSIAVRGCAQVVRAQLLLSR